MDEAATPVGAERQRGGPAEGQRAYGDLRIPAAKRAGGSPPSGSSVHVRVRSAAQSRGTGEAGRGVEPAPLPTSNCQRKPPARPSWSLALTRTSYRPGSSRPV